MHFLLQKMLCNHHFKKSFLVLPNLHLFKELEDN